MNCSLLSHTHTHSGVEIILRADYTVVDHIEPGSGGNALHLAAHRDKPAILCLLASMVPSLHASIYIYQYIHFQNVCALDKPTFNGDLTPLHIAAREGSIMCVECLVGYGADVGARDVHGNSPLHLVLSRKNMKPLSEWTLHLNEVCIVSMKSCNIIHEAHVNSSMSMCRELTTVFRMSLSTSLWPVSWSVKEPVWR